MTPFLIAGSRLPDWRADHDVHQLEPVPARGLKSCIEKGEPGRNMAWLCVAVNSRRRFRRHTAFKFKSETKKAGQTCNYQAGFFLNMVGTTGIEPVTPAMSIQCSTAELRANVLPERWLTLYSALNTRFPLI